MTWWRRVILSGVIGILNVAVLFATAFAASTLYDRKWIPIFVVGSIAVALMSVGVGCLIMRVGRPVVSKTALVVSVIFGNVVFFFAAIAADAAMSAHGLKSRIGTWLPLPIPVAIIIAATFWKRSPSVRLLGTAVVIGGWVTLAALLQRLFPEGDLVPQFRQAAILLLASTPPLLVALLVALWRDRFDGATTRSVRPTSRSDALPRR